MDTTTTAADNNMIETRDIVQRLKRDLVKAASTLSIDEARYLVDAYYQIQDNRKTQGNQVRALAESKEPHGVLQWLFTQNDTVEKQIRRALDSWTDAIPAARWAKSIVGIGPVISAGLAAHIDVSRCNTVGSIWRFAGLDPTVEWKKGTKRPWNGGLKTLCVHPACTVTTMRGHIPIAEVEVGDLVLTHLGRWRKVTQTFCNASDSTLHGVRAASAGNQVAWLTAGHPVYAAPVACWRSGRTHKPNLDTQQPFGWHGAESISPRWKLSRPVVLECDVTAPSLTLDGVEMGDGMVAATGRWPGVAAPIATLAPAQVAIDTDMMRLIGLYIAEGHIDRHRIVWSFHEDEADLHEFVDRMISRLTGKHASVSHNREKHALQLGIGCEPLADVFALTFGVNGDSMHFPMEWLGLPDHLLGALWAGIMDGDGDHKGRLRNRRISTSNVTLAKQIVDLGRRIGHSVSLHSEPGGRAFRIHVNGRDDREPRARATLRMEYIGPVFNIEVEEDHSYVVEGYAVHNCWKLGESFVKVSNHEHDFYGHLYVQRKEKEIAANEAGKFADQAARKLERFNIGKETDAYKAYAAGKLPPAHIHARAKRWAVKLFLAHYHHVAWTLATGRPPPKPYVISILGHTDMILPPNFEGRAQ